MPHAIGIDFGGTTIKSGVVLDGVIVKRGPVIETQGSGGQQAILNALVSTVEQLRENLPDLAGVGIGLPGIVDTANGTIYELTNVPGWEGMPLAQWMHDRTGLHTTIDNDVNAMTYGEWKYGAARNGRHVFCITLGTGVGGGIILDGRLYRGAQLGAGEIGHMSIDYRGLPSPSGNPGGLEEYVGNREIAERAVALYAAAGTTRAAEQCTPRDLARLAQDGDIVAMEMWEQIGLEVGVALANVIWILNPDTVIIGGGVSKAGELLLDPIRRTIAARTTRLLHEKLRILGAALGNDAGIIGNAALVIDSAPAGP